MLKSCGVSSFPHRTNRFFKGTTHLCFQYCEDFKDGDDKVISDGGYKSLTPAARLRILNVRLDFRMNMVLYTLNPFVKELHTKLIVK